MAFFSRFDEALLKNAQNIPIIIAIITQYNIISIQNTNVKRFVEKNFRKFQQSFLADCIKVEFCRKISSCRFFRVGSLKAASNDKKHSSQREKMKSRRSPLILAKYNPQKAILFRSFFIRAKTAYSATKRTRSEKTESYRRATTHPLFFITSTPVRSLSRPSSKRSL